MRAGRRSVTALGAAVVRAAHQQVDGGRVFADPLAGRLLGADGGDPAFEATFAPELEPVRVAVAARARFAEEALVASVDAGVRQAVVLGAGLHARLHRVAAPGVRGGVRLRRAAQCDVAGAARPVRGPRRLVGGER